MQPPATLLFHEKNTISCKLIVSIPSKINYDMLTNVMHLFELAQVHCIVHNGNDQYPKYNG